MLPMALRSRKWYIQFNVAWKLTRVYEFVRLQTQGSSWSSACISFYVRHGGWMKKMWFCIHFLLDIFQRTKWIESRCIVYQTIEQNLLDNTVCLTHVITYFETPKTSTQCRTSAISTVFYTSFVCISTRSRPSIFLQRTTILQKSHRMTC